MFRTNARLNCARCDGHLEEHAASDISLIDLLFGSVDAITEDKRRFEFGARFASAKSVHRQTSSSER